MFRLTTTVQYPFLRAFQNINKVARLNDPTEGWSCGTVLFNWYFPILGTYVFFEARPVIQYCPGVLTPNLNQWESLIQWKFTKFQTLSLMYI